MVSIPAYIINEMVLGEEKQSENSEENGLEFMDKLSQIETAIDFEISLYEYLKDLKKEKNQNKRLP